MTPIRQAQRVLTRGAAMVTVAAGVFLLAVASSSAAPTWLAPTRLSAAGQNAAEPQVSVDAQGDAVAVWQRAKVIEASSRPAASGSWQASTVLSSPEDVATAPQVALDSHGDAVAVWLSLHGAEYSIVEATRSGLNGAWQPAATLRNVGMSLFEPPGPNLAMDPQGDLVVIWPREETTVEAASRPAGSEFFAPPETLSATAKAQHPAEVAIDAAGNATALWEDAKTGETLVTVSSKPSSGKWKTPEALSAPGESGNEPRLAVDGPGDAVAVWERPTGGKEIIEAATNPASSGKWGKSVKLTNPSVVTEPAGQQVAIDSQGDAVVVWSWLVGGSKDVVEATEGQVASSTWKPSVALSGLGGNVEEAPQVAVNGKGNAVAVWERSNGTNELAEGAIGVAASGSWQAPVPLSAGGQNAAEPQVALDERGDAAAVWQRSDGKTSIAEEANYDIAGPLQSSLLIPAAGTVSQPLAFSVSPLASLWALGATSWSFGDGVSLAGTAVTHAFAAPGTYHVTVTTADILGGSTSTTGAVTIGAKPQAHAAVAPRITRARLTHSHFLVSKRSTAVSARAKSKPPQGTSFDFTLSEPARLQIAITRSATGLRSGRRCVAPSTKLKRHHAKRCKRALTVGTLTRAKEHGGADTLAFSGRIGKKALAAGAYRAILTASAGGLSSVGVPLSLTVVQ